MLKRTPLFETHLACGAKTVDFGGWDMPVNYGSQMQEHHAVRQSAGMFDVSHMRVVDLAGKDAGDFLRLLLANDVDKLAEGKALYSCMLLDAGGVIDDLIVYRLAGGLWRLVVNAGTADKDIAWINRLVASKGLAVTVSPRPELAMIAVQGPQARALLQQVLPAAAESIAALKPFTATTVGMHFIARTGYTGEDGCEIVLPAEAAAAFWMALRDAGIAPCGLGARDTLRLEAGMNLYGQDMDETVSPLESGLAWTVDLKSPRDFVGKSALQQQLATGGLRQLIGLKLLDKGVLRAHQSVSTAHGSGEITSGTYSPTLSASIALARLPGGVALGDTVAVDIRGKPASAVVVKPPFVRHGKPLI